MDKGLYSKYEGLERTDGRSAEGEKHHNCEYFILDLTHDIHAIAAIRAYAKSCGNPYPQLANDLRQKATYLESKRNLGESTHEQ